MELIQTTAEHAKEILEAGTRKIKATKGEGRYYVQSINTNNQTCVISSRKGHARTENNEDMIFFIQVPNNAKTVY